MATKKKASRQKYESLIYAFQQATSEAFLKVRKFYFLSKSNDLVRLFNSIFYFRLEFVLRERWRYKIEMRDVVPSYSRVRLNVNN
jgi:hypothetical protein